MTFLSFPFMTERDSNLWPLAWVALVPRRHAPYASVGLAWFSLALLPVIGVFQAGAQAMADLLISRYGLITVPWEEAGPCLRFSMTFEVGNKDFASEDEVFQALEGRLVHDRLS